MNYLTKLVTDWNRHVVCFTCPFEMECRKDPSFEGTCAEFVIKLIKEELKNDASI